MIIAQISDTHIAIDAADADQRIADFVRVIEDINELEPQPDVIVHSGDIVHNGLAEEYEIALNVLSKAKAPVYAIVGNKDNRQHLRNAFADYGFIEKDAEFIDYTVDDFPVKLVMLDTLQPYSNRGGFCQAQLESLGRMINSQEKKPVAVFMHHPPCEINVGPDPIHFEDPEVMLALRNALKQTGNVISIFSGHVHRSTSGYVEGIPVTVVSAVATTLRWGNYSDHMKSRPTYSIHRFDENLGFITETRIV